MHENLLVSVIIPVHNRVSMIGETLESILDQTYLNWECIVVDDGSDDCTPELMEFYCENDERIKFYNRPIHKPKGANACRNYGFEQSVGEYIIWFDSDDIMLPKHIEEKVKAIQAENCDFVVAKTQNFGVKGFQEPYIYEKKAYGIKASDFVLLKIHWYTYDVLLIRRIAEFIKWNERLKSWQDYNYFCKMLLKTEDGKYLDEVLTLRRLHSHSIQKTLTSNKKNFNLGLLQVRLLTFHEIHSHIDLQTRKELIYGMMNISFELLKMNCFANRILPVYKIVYEFLGLKSAVYFSAALMAVFVFKKGDFLLKLAKQK